MQKPYDIYQNNRTGLAVQRFRAENRPADSGRYQSGRPESGIGRTENHSAGGETRLGDRAAHAAGRTYLLHGRRHKRPAGSTRRLGDTAYVRDAQYAGDRTDLRNPVENAEDDTARGWEELQAHHITPKDTVIGIAASGTTPYVIGAMREARRHGILTGCITSNPGSPMAEEADIAIEMVVGPEYVTGSSRMKSGTGQKMILNMITTTVMIKLGRVKGNKMVNMQLSNRKLVDRGTRMLVDELGLPYDQANALLLLHGSVKKAVEAYRRPGPTASS